MTRQAKLVSSLPLDRWPEHDRQLWRRALSTDPLQPGGSGRAAHWRPPTRELVAYSYGVWLAWLEKVDRLDPKSKPEDRAGEDALRGFLSALRWAEYAEATCATRLRGLAGMLRVVAPHFDSGSIACAADRVASAAKRVRPPQTRSQDPVDLLDLARDLMKGADLPGRVPWQAAVEYRDGLIIALLVHRPIRVKNLASIELNQHLQRSEASFRLAFSGSEMKSGRPYSCDLIPISRQLSRYLSEFRPVLAARAGGASSERLWLSSTGKSLSKESVMTVVRRRTAARFGIGLGPHLFRHIIATTVAERAPNQVGHVPAILGHQSYSASERNYVHARAAEAVRALDDAIASIADADSRTRRAGAAR